MKSALLVFCVSLSILAEDSIKPPKPPPEFLEEIEKNAAEAKRLDAETKAKAAAKIEKAKETLVSKAPEPGEPTQPTLKELYKLGEKHRLEIIAHGDAHPDVKKRLASQKNKYLPSVEYEKGSYGSIRWAYVIGRSVVYAVTPTVRQIIEDKNMLIERGSDLVWISNFDTNGLVDDRYALNMDEAVFMYAGTRSYETHFGKKTVHELRKVTLKDK